MVAQPSIAYDDVRLPSAANENWRPVTSREPCPRCQRKKFCELSVDGEWLNCTGDKAGGILWGKRCDGALFHLGNGWTQNTRQTPRTPVPRPPAAESADLALCDRVYHRLFEILGLSAADRAHLTGQKRQLPADDLATYASLPSGEAQASVIAELLNAFTPDELLAVPGFSQHAGGKIRINVIQGKARAGLLIGLDDDLGFRQGVQVRTDDGAYYRLSSSKHGGPTAGSPAHVVIPDNPHPFVVLGTEGPIKAHIAARRTGCITIGLTGIDTEKSSRAILERLHKNRGTVLFIIAHDADNPAEKPERLESVDRARQRWAALAHELDYHVSFARWDNSNGKGIDDLLLGGGTYAVEPYRPSGNDAASATSPATEERSCAAELRAIHQANKNPRMTPAGRDIVLYAANKARHRGVQGIDGLKNTRPVILTLQEVRDNIGIGETAASARYESLGYSNIVSITRVPYTNQNGETNRPYQVATPPGKTWEQVIRDLATAEEVKPPEGRHARDAKRKEEERAKVKEILAECPNCHSTDVEMHCRRCGHIVHADAIPDAATARVETRKRLTLLDRQAHRRRHDDSLPAEAEEAPVESTGRAAQPGDENQVPPLPVESTAIYNGNVAVDSTGSLLAKSPRSRASDHVYQRPEQSPNRAPCPGGCGKPTWKGAPCADCTEASKTATEGGSDDRERLRV